MTVVMDCLLISSRKMSHQSGQPVQSIENFSKLSVFHRYGNQCCTTKANFQNLILESLFHVFQNEAWGYFEIFISKKAIVSNDGMKRRIKI